MGACFSSSSKFHLEPEYAVVKKLGQGGQGSVYTCNAGENGSVVAVKLIKRPITDWQAICLTREIQLQSQLVHVSIVRLRQLLLTPSHLGLVMDVCAGGSLAHYCRHPISEDLARFYMHQLMPAVAFMHHHRVVHRDLKLENVLVDMKDPPLLKLCDFGVAKRWGKRSTPHMRTIAGTPAYVAPDVLQGAFMDRQLPYDGTKADVWSLGVMLCCMLLGSSPFGVTHYGVDMDQEAELRRVWVKARHGSWMLSLPPKARELVSRLSPECRDLLNKVFCRDATRRPSVEVLMQHAWYNKGLLPQHQQVILSLQEQQQQLQKLELAIPSCDLNDQRVSRQMSSNIESIGISPEMLSYMSEARNPLSRSRANKDAPPPRIKCIDLATLAAASAPALSPSFNDCPHQVGGCPNASSHAPTNAISAPVHAVVGSGPVLSRQGKLSMVVEEGAAGRATPTAVEKSWSATPGQDVLPSPFEDCASMLAEFQAFQSTSSFPISGMRAAPHSCHRAPIIAPVKISALHTHVSTESELPSIPSFQLGSGALGLPSQPLNVGGMYADGKFENSLQERSHQVGLINQQGNDGSGADLLVVEQKDSNRKSSYRQGLVNLKGCDQNNQNALEGTQGTSDTKMDLAVANPGTLSWQELRKLGHRGGSGEEVSDAAKVGKPDVGARRTSELPVMDTWLASL